ncbi:MAG: hypothetical protein A2Z20_00095 [Bdellovibrionales bacterium RBG_16_40_8]|nr:MAG: hypothetical protein A2Z20_00095 [Bdellovibrionales bacterium RBG_16_40_8]
MGLDLSSVQQAYKRWAKYYNFYFGWAFHPGRQTAVELVDAKPGTRVLEVGVGTGLSLNLYPKDIHIVGIDISPEMLKLAHELVDEEKLSNVEALHIMNVEDMQLPDDSFDAVVAMYVATVVPDPKKFVNEMKRVCKPNGKIIILNHFNDSKKLFGKAANLLTPFSKFIGFRPNLSLEEFLEKTGVIFSNKISINMFSLWTILVIKNTK